MRLGSGGPAAGEGPAAASAQKPQRRSGGIPYKLLAVSVLLARKDGEGSAAEVSAQRGDG